MRVRPRFEFPTPTPRCTVAACRKCWKISRLCLVCSVIFCIVLFVRSRYYSQPVPRHVPTELHQLRKIEAYANRTLIEYFNPVCSCWKSVLSSHDIYRYVSGDLPHSTCSEEASFAGPGQKVVSFGLRQEEDYKASYQMLEINLSRIRKYYPLGWVVRLYTDRSSVRGGILCNLTCRNQDVFVCNIADIPVYGNLRSMMWKSWRHLPLGDPLVDVFLSRNWGSHVLNREAVAVAEWLNLDKPFTTMRDQRSTQDVAIPGGLWGARNSLLEGKKSVELREELIHAAKSHPRQHDSRGSKFDEELLKKVIYNPFQEDFVAFDSYHCEKYAEQTMVRPFPTSRAEAMDVVGNVAHHAYFLEECPVACRPVYGKNWTYC